MGAAQGGKQSIQQIFVLEKQVTLGLIFSTAEHVQLSLSVGAQNLWKSA